MSEVNERFLQVDVANLELIVRHLISEHPELADDEELLQDTLEGETDFDGVMRRLVIMARVADVSKKACDDLADDMAQRALRWEKKKAVARGTILRLMQMANIPKRKLPEATISLVKPRTSVTMDPDLLPDAYMTTIRKPVASAIVKAALEAGEAIPGAQLVTGPQGLLIR